MSNSPEAYQSPLDIADVDINAQHEIANGLEAERNALSEARAKQIAKAVMTRETLESVLTMNDLHGLAISHEVDQDRERRQQALDKERVNEEKLMLRERERTDQQYPINTLQIAAQDIDATRDMLKSPELGYLANADGYRHISRKVKSIGYDYGDISYDRRDDINRQRRSVLNISLTRAEQERASEELHQERIMQKRTENDRSNTPETLQGTAVIANEADRTSTEEIDFINNRVKTRGFDITREVMQRMKK